MAFSCVGALLLCLSYVAVVLWPCLHLAMHPTDQSSCSQPTGWLPTAPWVLSCHRDFSWWPLALSSPSSSAQALLCLACWACWVCTQPGMAQPLQPGGTCHALPIPHGPCCTPTQSSSAEVWSVSSVNIYPGSEEHIDKTWGTWTARKTATASFVLKRNISWHTVAIQKNFIYVKISTWNSIDCIIQHFLLELAAKIYEALYCRRLVSKVSTEEKWKEG